MLMRGKNLMIQGTGSTVGKSVICAALLRILRQDGLKAAPFKAQNMALNAYVTRDGKEIGRAQAMQAMAAGIEPSVLMNPVLLKPTSDRRSQVILNGMVVGTMHAAEYQTRKADLRGKVLAAYEELERSVDCVILEGAGSPAEINLKDSDIVNMSMAEAADAPVILVGDINLGGVFASLLGTMMLLSENERARVKGVLINKFRGDASILKPGLQMLEERIHTPVLGVIPWMDVELEDEDGESGRFERKTGEGDIRVAVIRLPRISNYTDFQPLSVQPGIHLYYAVKASELEDADLIIIPGTKNTIDDLLELRRRELDAAIIRHARNGKMVLGICGGYQMLGERISDPDHVESTVREVSGMGLLDIETVFDRKKQTTQTNATVQCSAGWLADWNGMQLDGYEIHAGKTVIGPGGCPWIYARNESIGVCNRGCSILGTYLHGIFENKRFCEALIERLRTLKGISCSVNGLQDYGSFREREFDRVAAIVRQSIDMNHVYRIIRGEV